MRRFFVYLSYDGTNYHGWQIQPNGVSVQGVLQGALSTILRQNISVVGAGRTDTGVHARLMVAHFDFDGEIDQTLLAYKLNRILPRDISVSSVKEVAPTLHARFSATRRTYHYYIHTSKNPFLRHYSCELHYDFDFEKMNVAAQHLVGIGDYGAFCKSRSDAKTHICHVMEAAWIKDNDTAWHFRITADRFLRNMVRAIVGTLIDVGRHRISVEEFDQVVRLGSREAAGESMPANALFLENVSYDDAKESSSGTL